MKKIAHCNISHLKFLCRLFFLFTFIFISSRSFAQITKTFHHQTIRQIIPQIEKISGYSFFYINEMPELNLERELKVKNQSIIETLKLLLKGTSIGYKIKADKQIILYQKTQGDINHFSSELKKITGRVVDNNNIPLSGATVQVKGTNMGAVTNSLGEFVVDVPEKSILTISYLGYLTQYISVSDKNVLDVVLDDNANILDELVVIGYGSIKKKDLTGAVISISGENVSNRKTTQLSTALQGALSGVMVTRDNNAPGASANSVRIRGITTIGNSDPLVIVDGVPGDLNQVNANDIDNISVLKDAASSAIYGSRAAAGVILITTKRGKESGLSLSYSCEMGIEVPTTQPLVVGVKRYLEMTNELRYNDNPIAGHFQAYTEDQVNNWLKYNFTEPNQYPITDWQNMILNKSAFRQTQMVQINGGSKSLRTMVSFTYDKIDGLFADRYYERYMLRLNNDLTINDKLDVKLDLNVKMSNNHQPVYDPLSSMRLIPSIYAAVWSDGLIAEGKSGGNPYGLMLEGGISDRWYTIVGGKSSIDYKPFKDFTLSLVFAPLFSFNKIKSFQEKATYTLSDNPDVIGGYLENNGIPFSTTKLTEERDDSYYITSQLIASYKKIIGKHSLNLMGGAENHFEHIEVLSASRDEYTLTEYPYLDSGPQTVRDNGGSAYEYAYQSWFGRMMYSYDNKYLFQANVRYDGSSRFAKNYRWGIFPAFSTGWVLTDEPFMKNIKPEWVSTIKLRASWGALGNERIGNYPYLSTMAFGNALFYNNGEVESQKTAAQKQYAVNNISWEKTVSTDFGLDLSLLQNRLRFCADYYVKNTTDMLLSLKIPDYLGMTDPQVNAGKMSTNGYEFDLNWSDHIGHWKYGASLNFSDFISIMGDLHGTKFLGDKVMFEGSEFNEWYGYKSNGLFLTNEDVQNSPKINNNTKVGDIKYKDISGPNGVPDGIISPEYDRVLLGGSLPRYLYGGNLFIGYHNIDLSIVFQGIGKQTVRLERDMAEPLRGDYGNIPALIDGNYWSTFNTDAQNAKAKYPRLTRVNVESNMVMSDFWLYDGGYFRLKNLSLGYSFPDRLIKVLGISKLRVYATVTDLFSISNYPKGWDPEMGTISYPITTTYIFGVSLDFGTNSHEK